MKQLIRNGRTLEYLDLGEGRPLIFLHGLGGSVQQILSLWEGMEGVRLLVPNQQGHGNSEADWEQFGFESLCGDILALMDAEALDRADVAGISMGAAVAVKLALCCPERVRSLTLIRPAWCNGPMDEVRQLAFRDLGRCLREGGYDAFRQTEGYRCLPADSAYTQNAFRQPFSEPDNVRNWRKYELLPAMAPFAEEAQLRLLTMPTAVVACRKDFCHPYAYGRWYAERIPGAVFTEIPDKDTDPARHREGCNRALREILER